jgi:DNA polymerase III subunit epsilon
MNKVIFDLETTSAEKDKCRIVQLGIKQIAEDGTVLINKSKMYNPGVPITPEAFKAHGITNEMVKDCPRFADDAKKLKKIFEDAILVGYNIMVFDIPVLLNEFDRAGVELNLSRQVIDVMKLEQVLSPRTLGAVYERYTGKKLEGAHDAMNDVEGTAVVLSHQLRKIANDTTLSEQYDEIMDKVGVAKDSADFFGKLKYNEAGNLYYTFGKCKGQEVLLNDETKRYAEWIISEKSFASDIKRVLRDELKKSTKKEFTRPKDEADSFYNPPKQKNLFDSNGQVEDDLPF